MDLEAIADELYALPASEFIAGRDARSAELRRSKQRDLAAEVKRLRRPSAAAEALNRLARIQPGAISQLVALGDQLRAAQARLSGGDLRVLGRQRREVLSSLSRLVSDLARDHERPLSSAAEREVLTSLDAALAEPSQAAALASGRLADALERTGLRALEPIDAGAASESAGDVAAAAAIDAETAAADAERARTDAAERAGAADRRVGEARRTLEDLERQVDEARSALDEVSAEADRLAATRDRAAELAARLRRDADARAVGSSGTGEQDPSGTGEQDPSGTGEEER